MHRLILFFCSMVALQALGQSVVEIDGNDFKMIDLLPAAMLYGNTSDSIQTSQTMYEVTSKKIGNAAYQYKGVLVQDGVRCIFHNVHASDTTTGLLFLGKFMEIEGYVVKNKRIVPFFNAGWLKNSHFPKWANHGDWRCVPVQILPKQTLEIFVKTTSYLLPYSRFLKPLKERIIP